MGSFRIAVLASGSGTNLQAIIDRVHEPGRVEIAGVGSDNPEALALERASDAGIATETFSVAGYAGREQRDRAIADWLERLEVDLVVLAGYMQLLSSEVVRRFEHRIVNVHPALLPSFPGLNAIGQALEHGVRVTGVTIHYVDEGVDSGPIIAQRAVPIPPDRDRALLEAEIHKTEHALYPEVIAKIAAGRVRIDAANPRLVHVDW